MRVAQAKDTLFYNKSKTKSMINLYIHNVNNIFVLIKKKTKFNKNVNLIKMIFLNKMLEI